jgi:hypothetical protein
MGEAVSRAREQTRAKGDSALKRAAPQSGGTPRASSVLRLQAQVGNQVTRRFLAQRTHSTPRHSAHVGLYIQRFEAGEHMQMGEVESMIVPDESNHTVAGSPRTYKVNKGDTPASIAVDLKVELDLLIARNVSLYKGGASSKHFFEAGAQLVVPGPKVTELGRDLGVEPKKLLDRNAASVNKATSPHGGTVYETFDRGTTIVIWTGKYKTGGTPPPVGGPPQPGKGVTTIQNVPFSYGEVMALGDFYTTPADMFKAPEAELRELKRLMALDRAKPGSVTTKQWQDATGGRYVELATKNSAHFGPHNKGMTPLMPGSGANHKDSWENYHKQALQIAQSGDRDKALTINAFGDHFLTDAFAGGHLFNKDDVMARFDAAFDAKAQTSFFEAVAKLAWADSSVSGRMKKLQSTAWHHAEIKNADRFQKVLQGIYDNAAKGKPRILSTVAKVIHDKLNKDGVDVENSRGDAPWKATGDAAMNADSLKMAQQAVAQSQVQVLNVVGKSAETLDFPALFKVVWDFTPRPTAGGTKAISEAIEQFTKPSDSKMRAEAAALIVKEIEALVDALVAEKELEPVKP